MSGAAGSSGVAAQSTQRLTLWSIRYGRGGSQLTARLGFCRMQIFHIAIAYLCSFAPVNQFLHQAL